MAIGVGTLALVGGVIAAPFTGGASLAGSAVGLTAMGLTVGAITITTTQLAMLLGFGAFAIYKKYNIKIGVGDKYIEMSPSK